MGKCTNDILNADDDGMEAAEIAKFIMVNHMGTIVFGYNLLLNSLTSLE